MRTPTPSALRASGFSLRWVRPLVLAAAALAGQAQAAVYTGGWDPAYGAPFTNLGWRGTSSFAVPDSCEPAGTADISNATACGGLAQITSAQVELYDTQDAGQTTLAQLVFNPSSMLVNTLRYVGGDLTQLTTSVSNLVDPIEDLSAFGVAATGSFFLQFTLAGPQLGWKLCSIRQTTECASGFNDGAQFPPQFTISRVPEPATLWLCAVALLGLVVPRRSRARSAQR